MKPRSFCQNNLAALAFYSQIPMSGDQACKCGNSDQPARSATSGGFAATAAAVFFASNSELPFTGAWCRIPVEDIQNLRCIVTRPLAPGRSEWPYWEDVMRGKSLAQGAAGPDERKHWALPTSPANRMIARVGAMRALAIAEPRCNCIDVAPTKPTSN